MGEWLNYLTTLNDCGIPYSLDWGSSILEKLQGIILSYGYNITHRACNSIVIDGVYHVFSSGKPHWTTYEDDPADFKGHKGWGQPGMFLFAYNTKTGESTPRQMKVNNKVIATGLQAIERKLGVEFPKYTSR